MAWIEHRYGDSEALIADVAERLKERLCDALAHAGRATVALAGGRTPLPIYRRLASRAIEWPKVVVMPTDERCVPHDHPACNLREIDAAFAAAHGVRLESLTPPDGDPARAPAWARDMLVQHAPPFDAVLLGMGQDAHTASLFPGAVGLAAALDPDSGFDVCRIDPEPLPPEAPFPRITLTAARLRRTRSLHLVITGEGKHEVLRQAQTSHEPLRHPIAALLQAADAMVHIHWSP